jgi:hypothetical protein
MPDGVGSPLIEKFPFCNVTCVDFLWQELHAVIRIVIYETRRYENIFFLEV